MSKRSRALKRFRQKRRRLFIFILIGIIFAIVAVGYYRSNLSLILNAQDYLNSTPVQIYFLRDSNYYIIDNFKGSDLAYPEGTKVSGYDALTTSPMTFNQEFLNGQIAGINALITGKYYNNWDTYSEDLQNTINSSFPFGDSNLEFYIDSARYSLNDLEELHEISSKLQALNTGSPFEITLDNIGLMTTGFVVDSVSEYDKLAGEIILGNLNSNTISGLDRLSTDGTTALRIINNDHCYAIVSVNNEISIQGENEVKELKAQYSEGLSNSEYFNMLISRIDRLRLYPKISFTKDDKTFPAFLVDIVEIDNQKICVLMIKDYIQDLIDPARFSCQLNTQDYQAFVIPRSAIINKDDKTYVELLQKGYFVNEVEVNVNLYDKGKAILRTADNPNLSSGTSIKIYP